MMLLSGRRGLGFFPSFQLVQVMLLLLVWNLFTAVEAVISSSAVRGSPADDDWHCVSTTNTLLNRKEGDEEDEDEERDADHGGGDDDDDDDDGWIVVPTNVLYHRGEFHCFRGPHRGHDDQHRHSYSSPSYYYLFGLDQYGTFGLFDHHAEDMTLVWTPPAVMMMVANVGTVVTRGGGSQWFLEESSSSSSSTSSDDGTSFVIVFNEEIMEDAASGGGLWTWRLQQYDKNYDGLSSSSSTASSSNSERAFLEPALTTATRNLGGSIQPNNKNSGNPWRFRWPHHLGRNEDDGSSSSSSSSEASEENVVATSNSTTSMNTTISSTATNTTPNTITNNTTSNNMDATTSSTSNNTTSNNVDATSNNTNTTSNITNATASNNTNNTTSNSTSTSSNNMDATTSNTTNNTTSNNTNATSNTTNTTSNNTNATSNNMNSTTSNTANKTTIPELMYLAYYYPWYYEGDWSRHEIQDIPLLGYYGTDSAEIAEQHIEWALRANISSWVVSWWGTDVLSKRHFDQGMLNAKNFDQIRFCMLYESKKLNGTSFENGTAQQELLQDLRTMKEEYFDHPSYLRVNGGRPVVVVYITRWKALYGEFFNRTVLDDLRQEIGEDIFFIADEPFFQNGNCDPETSLNGLHPNDDGTTVFDAYTTYNMFQDSRVIPNETASDYMLREAMPIFQAWSKDTLFFPNVMPMYHDFRGHEPLLGDGEDFLRQLYEVACLPRPEWASSSSSSSSSSSMDIPDMVFVTSFNEWWEGTQIEPDDEARYGFDFLDTLASFKADVDANGYYWC